jgi:CRISPR/Cas system-associated exonuclease Cas4 (RecB family)
MGVHGKGPPGMGMPLYNVMDTIEKRYYDKYRSGGLPPLLKGKLHLKLADQQIVERLRRHIGWEDSETKAVLHGRMDDCFIDKSGALVVMDNKTKTKEVPEVEDDHVFQLEAYAFLLAKNGFKVSDIGYIVYFVADKESDLEKGVKFQTDIKPVRLHTGRVLPVFRKAVEVAGKARPPAHHKECETCIWVKEIGNI